MRDLSFISISIAYVARRRRCRAAGAWGRENILETPVSGLDAQLKGTKLEIVGSWAPIDVRTCEVFRRFAYAA
jgi:hypothetical protein